jgi:aminotransferase
MSPSRYSELASNVTGIIGSPIKNTWMYAEKKGWDISLGEGSPFFSTPSYILNNIIQEIESQKIARYCPPQGFSELRKLISEKLAIKNKIQVTPEQIIVSSGANEGVGIALFSIIVPGDEVILTTPGYCSHIEMVKLLRGIPRFIELKANNNWELNTSELIKLISKKTKCIVLSNPSNPIGTVFTQQILEKIVHIALIHGLYIISDEAYEDFVYDGLNHFSIGSILEASENVISCFSFSKSYSLAGWRVGYTSSSSRLCKQMLKIHEDFSICAPTISQVAAIAALKGPQEHITKFREILSHNRDLLLKDLEKISFIEAEYTPTGAFYLFAKIKNPRFLHKSTVLCKRLIDDTRVVFIPGKGFGPTANNYLRLSFSVEEQDIHKAFEILEKWVE